MKLSKVLPACWFVFHFHKLVLKRELFFDVFIDFLSQIIDFLLNFGDSLLLSFRLSCSFCDFVLIDNFVKSSKSQSGGCYIQLFDLVVKLVDLRLNAHFRFILLFFNFICSVLPFSSFLLQLSI